jgi:hypothetical protein
MRELAILDPWGSIVNVVTTSKPRAEVQKEWPSHRVLPLADVPAHAKHAYEYWGNRP